LVLSGSNSYQGSTDVLAGALVLGSSAALPATTVVNVGGGTLDASAFSSTIAGLA